MPLPAILSGPVIIKGLKIVLLFVAKELMEFIKEHARHKARKTLKNVCTDVKNCYQQERGSRFSRVKNMFKKIRRKQNDVQET